MIILPAIDLLDGKCVRLVQGEYGSETTVAEDPFAMVEQFSAAGAGYIHIVDLDGAKAGRRVNHELICALAKVATVPVEVGGGIRTIDDLVYYAENGVDRVILGSRAVKEPAFVEAALELYADKVAVGIDAKNGYVRVSGWLEDSKLNYLDFAKQMDALGVKNLIYTDISKDGMLSGIDAHSYKELKETVLADITASGGIKDIADIRALAEVGIYGAICGKSIYAGTLDLTEAIEVGRSA